MKSYYFVFNNGELLLERCNDKGYNIPCQAMPPTETKPWTNIIEVGEINGISVKCYKTENTTYDTERYETCPLRQSYYKLEQDLYLMAGKCAELIYWDINTKYCGVCGGLMRHHTNISKRCEECGKEVWPQLATAVIVLIRKGDKILLVRALNFKRNFYGLVAGFVETGETLEEAVMREAKEETGLTINNIRYFGSQPWPYPCGLMIGFTADYVSGEIKIQEEELAKAEWFSKDNLPPIPEKLSIARMLIDSWLKEKQK